MKATLSILLAVLSASMVFSQDFVESRIDDEIETFALADFNNDGKMDVVGIDYVLEGPARLRILLNTSDIDLKFEGTTLEEGLDINGSVAAGDIDRDGDADILYSIGDDLELYVYRNEGSNNFTSESLGLNVEGVNQLEMVDLEGDGDMDLIGYVFDKNEILAFINDGSGSFSEEKMLEHQNDISDVDYGDIDGDGDIDLVLSVDKFSGETVSIYLNDSLNNFMKFTSADINALNSAVQIEMVDFDQDGKMDIVGLNKNKFTAFIQSDIFGFVPQDLIEPSNVGNLSQFAVADFDKDGDYDVVIGDFNSTLHWYKNQAFAFTQQAISEVQPIYEIVSHDFDGDGDSDFIASNGNFWMYRNVIGEMSSSFSTKKEDAVSIGPNPFHDVITVAPLRGGNLDIEIYNTEGRKLDVFEIQGKTKLDLSQLPRGTYNFRVIDQSIGIPWMKTLIKI